MIQTLAGILGKTVGYGILLSLAYMVLRPLSVALVGFVDAMVTAGGYLAYINIFLPVEVVVMYMKAYVFVFVGLMMLWVIQWLLRMVNSYFDVT